MEKKLLRPSSAPILGRKSYFSSSASADASSNLSSEDDADVSALSYFGSEISFLCFGALHQLKGRWVGGEGK